MVAKRVKGSLTPTSGEARLHGLFPEVWMGASFKTSLAWAKPGHEPTISSSDFLTILNPAEDRRRNH